MTSRDRVKRQLKDEIEASGDAPAIAAAAALLEMGDRLGFLDHIVPGVEFSGRDLAEHTDIPRQGVANYLEAMESAGIVRSTGDDRYVTADDFARIQHQAGYVSWVMNANRPFIENAREYLSKPDLGTGAYTRDGRQVAVSSQWMGSLAFYPAALETIIEAKPERIADLGSGTCRLLIEVLREFPSATAVGLDLDGPSCRAAETAAAQAGVGERLTVVERSIQSIATDPAPVADTDVIHAGFVFHDMMPEEENVADQVLANCRNALRPGGIMAITDAVPYLRNERERRFSAMVTFYHRQFMKRKLLTEQEWVQKLTGAGFHDVRVVELGFPTGRLFVATR